MAVLLLAEITNGELALDATAKAITAASSLGEITALCCGESAAAAGEVAAKLAGVSKVLVAEDALLGHRMAESTAALIVSLAGDFEHIVAPATTDAKILCLGLPRYWM
jgi:electron transfer flavoprotein alpha subunit